MEISISSRRNKIGKRFGFARFQDADDERMLAVRMDNVLLSGKKIHVNLPRFQRGVTIGGASSRGYSCFKVGKDTNSHVGARRDNRGKFVIRKDNKSYTEVHYTKTAHPCRPKSVRNSLKPTLTT